MDELARFTTTTGGDVLLNMGSMIACWEGKSFNTIVFNILGIDEPVVVVGDFETFIGDWLTYYDYRQSKKKKPHRKQQGSIVKLAAVHHLV